MKKVISSVCLMILFVFQLFEAQAQEGAAFTFQGSLKDGNVPANGNYDIKLEYFDVGIGGTSLGSFTDSNVPVINGIFTEVLNGSTSWMTPGRNLFIEISVRPSGSSSPHTTLAPRQRITSAPYAITSLRSSDSPRLNR
ncbi:MAG: hypothetical protein ABI646_02585 [Acidobacteriota bacterium]